MTWSNTLCKFLDLNFNLFAFDPWPTQGASSNWVWPFWTLSNPKLGYAWGSEPIVPKPYPCKCTMTWMTMGTLFFGNQLGVSGFFLNSGTSFIYYSFQRCKITHTLNRWISEWLCHVFPLDLFTIPDRQNYAEAEPGPHYYNYRITNSNN